MTRNYTSFPSAEVHIPTAVSTATQTALPMTSSVLYRFFVVEHDTEPRMNLFAPVRP